MHVCMHVWCFENYKKQNYTMLHMYYVYWLHTEVQRTLVHHELYVDGYQCTVYYQYTVRTDIHTTITFKTYTVCVLINSVSVSPCIAVILHKLVQRGLNLLFSLTTTDKATKEIHVNIQGSYVVCSAEWICINFWCQNVRARTLACNLLCSKKLSSCMMSPFDWVPREQSQTQTSLASRQCCL